MGCEDVQRASLRLLGSATLSFPEFGLPIEVCKSMVHHVTMGGCTHGFKERDGSASRLILSRKLRHISISRSEVQRDLAQLLGTFQGLHLRSK